MAGCEDCYFGGKIVHNKGPEDSPFVIVGESPGIMELHKGQPFVGPSGVVIDEALERAGLRSTGIEPLFTNAISCFPRKKTPESLQEACLRCRSRLFDEVSKYPRKVILTLGAGALWSIFGNSHLKITRERGKLFPHDLASVGVVTAVHPAFLIRGAGNYKQFQRDIDYAVRLLSEGLKARRLPNGVTYSVVEDEETAQKLEREIQRLPAGTLSAQDIETTGFNYMTDRILVCAFQFEPKNVWVVPTEFLTNRMFNLEVVQAWHNGKFDCRFLKWAGYSRAQVDEDTMLMSYTLNERRGIHDQDQVASDWIGSPNHKDMVSQYYKGKVIDEETGEKRQRNLSDAPKEELYEYVAKDVADAYQIRNALAVQINQDRDLSKWYYGHLLDAGDYLIKVEMNGMLVDQAWVQENTKRLTSEMQVAWDEFQDVAQETSYGPVNLGSWKQLKAYLYDHLKLAPNSWATDDDTLEELLAKYPGQKAVVALRAYRKAAKAFGTYVRPLYPPNTYQVFKGPKKKPEWAKSYLYPDGRVHQTYLLHGTATSRLSCRDPNVQNIPRDPRLRGQFIPRPGYGILEVDYSQAELRSLAVLSGCPALMEIFLTGKDLHVETSIFLFGPEFTKEDKMVTKAVNFGIVYGRTAPSIATDPDLNKARLKMGKPAITVAEAQSWIDGWARRFPGAWEFIQKCRMAPVLGQTITTCFGNKKRPGVVSREKLGDLQNESANFPHQSIASNLTVRAGADMFDYLRDEYDTHVINTVHDCIVTEIPMKVDLIKMVADYMVDNMQKVPLRYPGLDKVPFKAEPEFGKRWGNLMKFKELDAIGWDFDKVPEYIAPH